MVAVVITAAVAVAVVAVAAVVVAVVRMTLVILLGLAKGNQVNVACSA